MKKILLILSSFVILMLFATSVMAATELQILGFDVAGEDIIIHLAVNRGIDSAARNGDAPFRVVGSLSYPGLATPIAIDLPLKDTTKTGQVDPSTVTLSFSITVDRPPVASTDITGSFILISKPEKVVLK